MEILVADSFSRRLVGLAFRRRPPAGCALLIPRCSSVHTFGMRYSIDVAFLDAAHGVLAIRRDVGPRRILAKRGARAVLEAPAGQLDRYLGLLLSPDPRALTPLPPGPSAGTPGPRA